MLAVILCAELVTASALSLDAYGDEVIYDRPGKLESNLEKYAPAAELVYSYDGGFYRLERVGEKLNNDPHLLALRGISGSTSTLNASVIQLLQDVGYGAESHFANYYSTSPLADSLFGVKYIISSKAFDDGVFVLNGELTDASPDGVFVYENPYALPIAYSANGAVISEDTGKYGIGFEALNGLASSLTGEELSVYRPVTLSGIELGGGVSRGAADGYNYFLAAEEDREYYYIDLKVRMSGNGGSLFASFPLLPENEAVLFVNGERLTKLREYDGTHIQLLGSFEKDETVTVRLQWKEGSIGLRSGINYFYRLDSEALSTAYGLLSDGAVTVTEHTDTRLAGNFTYSASAPVLFTTVPYDADWTLRIDGKQIETVRACGALLSADLSSLGLTEGKHTFELTFVSTSLVTGAIISAVGALALIAVALLPRLPLSAQLLSRLGKGGSNNEKSPSDE